MPNTLSNRCVALLIVAASFTLGLPINRVVAGCNSGTIPDTDLLRTANCQTSAPGTDLLVVGAGAQAGTAGGVSNTALGDSALAGTGTGSFNTAVGAGATVIGSFNNNTAIGANTTVARGSVAIGGADTLLNAASALGPNSVAIGFNSQAGGTGVVAVGLDSGNQSSGDNNTAIGSGAGQNVIGDANTASGANAGQSAALAGAP